MTVTPWTARVLTLFPEMFPGPLGHSLAGAALERSAWALETVDIRTFAADVHRTVDGPPFGGGAGMVMRPDVVDAAIAAASAKTPTLPLVYLTPRGAPFTQSTAHELADGPGCILLCGRYEGVDERVLAVHQPREISLGDFVLSGGEPAAIALIDACVRLLPGVVGTSASIEDESFEANLLEYPHFTRPRQWRGVDVPDVLLSGHHAKVTAWRHQEAQRITQQRRPDLWARFLGQCDEDQSNPLAQVPRRSENLREHEKISEKDLRR
jgi:tRNA (guanine37-N1)-methyltransferase